MKYKIVIIEDNKRDYQKLASKIDYSNFELLGYAIEPNTNFRDYVNVLSLNQGEIYFVDWKLLFYDGEYAPNDIFCLLEGNNFDFLNKFWIFYSEPEGNKVADFLPNYFPNAGYYHMPGKGNIIGQITKSGKDHFKEAIDKALTFINKHKVPVELKEIEVGDIITVREFGGACYDTDEPNSLSSGGKTIFQLTRELFLCMAYDSSFGIILYFDDNNYQLKKQILRFNDATTVVKERIGTRMIDQSRKGFFYNPTFFDQDRQVINSLVDYVNINLENIKIFYKVKKYNISLEKYIKILQEHGLLNYS